jgi:hypothetical protein
LWASVTVVPASTAKLWAVPSSGTACAGKAMVHVATATSVASALRAARDQGCARYRTESGKVHAHSAVLAPALNHLIELLPAPDRRRLLGLRKGCACRAWRLRRCRHWCKGLAPPGAWRCPTSWPSWRAARQVLDRPGLEASACTCYATDRRSYSDWLGVPSFSGRRLV